MRVLILGGPGMLGHKLWQTFSARFDTYATFRQLSGSYIRFGILDETRTLPGFTAEQRYTTDRCLGASLTARMGCSHGSSLNAGACVALLAPYSAASRRQRSPRRSQA